MRVLWESPSSFQALTVRVENKELGKRSITCRLSLVIRKSCLPQIRHPIKLNILITLAEIVLSLGRLLKDVSNTAI